MKTITLHQPWASLIAVGIKTIETRSWPAPRAVVGTRIAIHAGKRPISPRDVREWGEDIREIFFRRDMGLRLTSVPLGSIVATARLAGVFKVTQNPRLAGISGWEPDYSRVLATNRLSTPEHREIEIDPWGDFSEGRWLWLLEDVQALETPIPARGRQRLWDWDGGKAL